MDTSHEFPFLIEGLVLYDWFTCFSIRNSYGGKLIVINYVDKALIGSGMVPGPKKAAANTLLIILSS